ncbi:MAG: hypothetical protein WA715_11185 [Candidatus Acidiferrum sp.]
MYRKAILMNSFFLAGRSRRKENLDVERKHSRLFVFWPVLQAAGLCTQTDLAERFGVNNLLLAVPFPRHTSSSVLVQRSISVSPFSTSRLSRFWVLGQQIEFAQVLARLDPAQCLAVNSWYKKQNRLKTEGDEGFSNVSQIVSWLLNRGYAVTGPGLDMALTNVQNNSSRKLFWHEGPKQDRAIWNGKLNHALAQNNAPSKRTEPVQEFHPNGRRNHAYKANADEPNKKAPRSIHGRKSPNAYKAQGNTHGQKAKGDIGSGIQSRHRNRQIVAGDRRCTRSDREGVGTRTLVERVLTQSNTV